MISIDIRNIKSLYCLFPLFILLISLYGWCAILNTSQQFKKGHKVFVFEEPTVDMFVFIDNLPERGSDILGRALFSLPGGAINFSIVAKRLGLYVSIGSYIGNDPFEPVIRKTLHDEGIDDTLLETKEGRTTTCITLVDEGGERTFITVPGIGKKITPEYLENVKIENYDTIYISGYSLSIDPIRTTTLKLVELATELGKSIVFDPGTAVEYVPRKIIDKVIEKSDIIFLNDREAYKITGFDLLELAACALREKSKAVVIKLGPRGCAIFSEKTIKRYPTYNVDVVDTTGAGDSFNAAFLYCFEKTKNLELCAKFANLIGALSVSKKGAGPNLPTREEISEEINKRNLDEFKKLIE